MQVECQEKKDTLFSIVPFDPLTSPFGGSMEEFMALGFVKRVSSSPPPLSVTILVPDWKTRAGRARVPGCVLIASRSCQSLYWQQADAVSGPGGQFLNIDRVRGCCTGRHFERLQSLLLWQPRRD